MAGARRLNSINCYKHEAETAMQTLTNTILSNTTSESFSKTRSQRSKTRISQVFFCRRYMIRHLDHYLDYQREYRGGCCSPARRFLARNLFLVCGNRFGNYLLTLYLFIKVHQNITLLPLDCTHNVVYTRIISKSICIAPYTNMNHGTRL